MSNLAKIFVLLLLLMSFGYIYKVSNKKSIGYYIYFSEASKPESLEDNQRNVSINRIPNDILSQGKNIIFIETTDRMAPPHLVLCAVESAARVYPDRTVAFFMKGLTNIKENMDKIRKSFPTLSSFSNVHFLPLTMEEIFKDTPLLPWYLKVTPKLERYWTHVSSDACRLALIWKYGGIYMDTDIISIKPISVKDFLVAESAPYSSNGAFGFSPRHDFPWTCMESFVKNYKGDVWGNQGPLLFTRILNTKCSLQGYKAVKDIICGNITYMNPQRFYPIQCSDWESYYRVWDKLPVFNDSYSLHLWNYMNRVKKTVVPGSNTLVDNLYRQHCPNIYNLLKENLTG